MAQIRDPPPIVRLKHKYPLLRSLGHTALHEKLLWELAIATLDPTNQRERETEKMARLSADFSDVQDFEPVPKDRYRVQIKNITEEKSKKENPQLRFDHKIQGGDYDGRELRDWIVIGGKGDKGPITPFGLYRIIEAFGLEWGCKNCGEKDGDGFVITQRSTPFLTGDGRDGRIKGRKYCPDCGQPVRLDYETNNWLGKEGYALVSIGKRLGSDRPVNNIDGYQAVD